MQKNRFSDVLFVFLNAQPVPINLTTKGSGAQTFDFKYLAFLDQLASLLNRHVVKQLSIGINRPIEDFENGNFIGFANLIKGTFLYLGISEHDSFCLKWDISYQKQQ